MLDIKVIRENLDWSKKKLATRGIKPEELDELVEIDTSVVRIWLRVNN